MNSSARAEIFIWCDLNAFPASKVSFIYVVRMECATLKDNPIMQLKLTVELLNSTLYV